VICCSGGALSGPFIPTGCNQRDTIDMIAIRKPLVFRIDGFATSHLSHSRESICEKRGCAVSKHVFAYMIGLHGSHDNDLAFICIAVSP
jgi:hypothetical protein